MKSKKYLFWLMGFILIAVFNAGPVYAREFSPAEVKSLKEAPGDKEYTAKDKKNIFEQKLIDEEYKQLKKKHEALLKEKERIVKDRDNILKQIKIFFKEKAEYAEKKEFLEKIIEENKILHRERDNLKEKNAVFTEEIKNVTEERDRLQKLFNEANIQLEKDTQLKKIKRLEGELSSFKKEKNNLANVLRQTEKKAGLAKNESAKLKARLSNTQDKLTKAQVKFKDLRKDYKELTVENKSLNQKIAKIPKKFTGLARQNKKLIKETANMRYNLGVFYCRYKEYKRAVEEFTKVVEIKPGDAAAHYNLGFIYAEYLIDQPKAIKHFKEYLFITKGLDKDADKAKKYILIWETYGEQGAK